MNAKTTYIIAQLTIACILVWLAIIDVLLYWRGEQTITAWLKANPMWYAIPFAGYLLFLTCLHFHLWIQWDK